MPTVIEANRNYPRAYFQLALALAQLDRLAEAHATVKVGIAINPSFTVPRARVNWTSLSDDPTYLAQLEPIFDGLCKAGTRTMTAPPLRNPRRRCHPLLAPDERGRCEHSAQGAANRGVLRGGVVEPIGDGLARAAGSAEKDGLQRQKFGRSNQDAPSLVVRSCLLRGLNGLIELGQSRTIDPKYPTGLRGDLTAVSWGGFRAALS